jgi:hypothetical protein
VIIWDKHYITLHDERDLANNHLVLAHLKMISMTKEGKVNITKRCQKKNITRHVLSTILDEKAEWGKQVLCGQA